MKVHFIAIGGSVMHSLAICLKRKGYFVTGSDDKFFDPSKKNLKKEGLLTKEGWFPNKITKELDLVILGMHAKINNPELKEAKKKNIKIYSFPEFIAFQSIEKQKIVIAGSHGKTTITSMIMHVFKKQKIKFDYLVGAKIKGFDNMVHLSNNKIIVIEGDEYFSSKLDMKAKFLHYKPDILVISGISWDHINVYPTYQSYCNVFADLLKNIDQSCNVFYSTSQKAIFKIVKRNFPKATPYTLPKYSIKKEQVIIYNNNLEYKLSVFGKHNLYNIQAAKSVCNNIGIKDSVFLKQIMSFSGAQNRLELLIVINSKSNFYRDFAHSPSKVKASIEAVNELFPDRKLVSCLELHTFSSLTLSFISQYKNVFKKSNIVWLFFSKKELQKKGLQTFSKKSLLELINHHNIKVFNYSKDLKNVIEKTKWHKSNLLLMSSGNFEGINFKKLSIH